MTDKAQTEAKYLQMLVLLFKTSTISIHNVLGGHLHWNGHCLPYECADMLICQSVMHTSYLGMSYILFMQHACAEDMCPKITFFTVWRDELDFSIKGKREGPPSKQITNSFVSFHSCTEKTAVLTGEALAKGCCFVSVNSRGLMGFHNYPLMLDAANLPHIDVNGGDNITD